MKSLNKSRELWTNMSAKEVENTQFSAKCCLNVKIDSAIHNGNQEVEKAEPVTNR